MTREQILVHNLLALVGFVCAHRNVTSPRKCDPWQRRRLKADNYYRCNNCAADLPCHVFDNEPKSGEVEIVEEEVKLCR